MKPTLKILMLEDSSLDAEIIHRLLNTSFPACEILLKMDKSGFLAALEEWKPDVILADNSLPQFSAAAALEIVQSRKLHIPFIMVTGTISEEFAAGIIKLGADDYILKDRLTRLPTAIAAAVKQRAAEKEKEETVQKLIESEEQYRALFQNNPLPMFVYDVQTFNYLDVNQAAINHYGFTKKEFLQMGIKSIRPPEDVEKLMKAIPLSGETSRNMGVWRHLKKDRSIILVRVFSHDTIFDNKPARIVMVEDITEIQKTEEALRSMELKIADQKIQEQKKISRAIINAQETERNHIGQELHDNVNQILAGTKMYLSLAVRENNDLKELVKYPMELIDTSINEIRLLSSKHVTPLRNINLQELIQSLASTITETSPIKVTVDYDLPVNGIEDDLKLNLYRILQEQVNNTLKHAHATALHIQLKEINHCIELLVSDDGKGFNTTLQRKGIGISNMINRIESFNGELTIESAAGQGCKTHILIPLHN